MMSKTKKRLLVLAASGMALAAAGYGLVPAKELTGEQWLYAQTKYMSELEVYADEMDEVVALYLRGSIDIEDFQNHLRILDEELGLMETVYQQEKKEHPVRIGSHTYATKKGSEAVEDCYAILNRTISSMMENAGDRKTLGYKYLAFHQEVIEAVGVYMAARDADAMPGGEDHEE